MDKLDVDELACGLGLDNVSNTLPRINHLGTARTGVFVGQMETFCCVTAA